MLIVTDYAACVTLFFKVHVLDCVFTLNYGGAVPSVNWDVTSAVRSVYAGEIKKKKRETSGIIHISFVLFHLCTVRLLLYALSCQCVQADLLSRCMHNLAAMKPA